MEKWVTHRKLENVIDIKLTENQQELLDSTTDALDRLHLGDLEVCSRAQLIKVINALTSLGKQYNAQIQDDISLIGTLDENCFNFSYKNEKIDALKTYSNWTREREN